MQHRAHLLRRDVDLGLAIVAMDIAVAIAMAVDDPGDLT
jgi:hypothetical protein